MHTHVWREVLLSLRHSTCLASLACPLVIFPLRSFGGWSGARTEQSRIHRDEQVWYKLPTPLLNNNNNMYLTVHVDDVFMVGTRGR